MDGLKVTVEQKGKIAIAKLEGFIDSQTAPIVETAITDLMSKKQYKIIVDLSKIDYVSSAGWGIFVGYVNDLRKYKGDLKFSNMKNEVREIFELLDFTSILEYYGDIESAANAFNKK